MRLLATIGYQQVLFGKEANYSVLIDALANAQLVEEEGPYDARVLVQAKNSGELGVKLIQDTSVKLPEAENRGPILEKLLEVSKEKDALASKVYTLEQQLKKFTDLSKGV